MNRKPTELAALGVAGAAIAGELVDWRWSLAVLED
jgi:hypothetical protein